MDLDLLLERSMNIFSNVFRFFFFFFELGNLRDVSFEEMGIRAL